MKLSYNWLKEFVPLDVTPQTLAEQFTMKAAEVEGVQLLGQDMQKVVVGEILEIRPHPRSTKLQLTKVSVGSDTLEIVCGAKNIRVGQKVPTALIGSSLPGGVAIAAREIQGVKSEGMLASAAELGLSADAAGILILPAEAAVGTDVRAVLGLDDAILDVNVLADRSYLLSHLGAARDIGAMRRQSLLIENYGRTGADLITNSAQKNSGSIQIIDPALCPRYSMIMLSNLRIAPSPAWLSARLQSLGVRPVNNLVDLTNYVMLEVGQPLHAFDQAKLTSHKMIVRPAKPGEKITTIDGVVRELTEDMLVVADQSKPLAIAGVMGGKESEIATQTSGALIESANFDAKSIRKTAQALKLRSDASMRFERGVDPNLTAVALARLVELLPKAGLVDATTSTIIDSYPAPLVRQPIRFQPTYVKRLCGVDVLLSEQIRILQDLGLIIDDRNYQTDGELLVTPPSFRADINVAADLVEEIIRLFGLEKVPRSLPLAKLIPQPFDSDRHWSRKIKNILRGAGFTEVETYSFADAKVLQALKFDPRENIALENPMSPEQAYLRSSLIPNALAIVTKNISYGRGAMRFFELGRTFRFVRGKEYAHEPLMLSVVEVSASGRTDSTKSGDVQEPVEWRHLAQVLESILFHFGLDTSTLKRKPFTANPAFHDGRTALLEIGGEDIGFLAEVHPLALDELGINRRVALIDLEFDKLMRLARGERQFQPIPKYPAVVRDLSLIVDEKLPAQDVIAQLKKSGGDLLRDVQFFDRFTGKGIAAGKKSYAFHLVFQSDQKTLDEIAVNTALAAITKALAQKNILVRT